MYGKVKLSKRQIKEDKFTSFILSSKKTFMDNWQFFVVGIVIVVLIIVAFVYYIENQESQHIDAGNRYSSAIIDFGRGNNEEAMLKLDQIINDYPEDIFAQRAVYQLAKIHMEDKNYPEAQRYFELYIKNYDNQFFKAASVAGLAVCLENQANYSEAAEKFYEAYIAYPESAAAGDYLYGSIRNYIEAGDLSNASEKLEIMKKEFKGSQYEQKAIRVYSENSDSE